MGAIAERKGGTGRRAFLKGAGSLVGFAAVGMPFVHRAAAAERSLRIASFGGNFDAVFALYLQQEFEAATGIRVERVSAEAASQPGAAVDLRAVSQQDLVRGSAMGTWAPLDARRIPNLDHVNGRFLHLQGGRLDGVGAMAWYQTLVVNPAKVALLPTSWKALWEPGRAGAWGLAAGSRSTLFEITAATWFGGNDALQSEDGIRQVVAKIEALKPNVRLWWDSEGAMQTAYEADEVVGGMYFHDEAGLMARDGTAIASVFPREGAVIDFGSWCQPVGSAKADEAAEFINFMSSPAAQAMMTRTLGTAPLIDRRLTDLTEAEFAAASTDTPPIALAVGARMRFQDIMGGQFARMLTS